MPRRKSNNDGGLIDLFFKITSYLPWWIDIIGAVLSYVIFHFLSGKHALASINPSSPNTMISNELSGVVYLFSQYLFPIIFTIGAILSAAKNYRGDELLGSMNSRNITEKLAAMHWSDFEKLIGAWFRKNGFLVTEAGGAHADGGVDIELHKNGELYLVQCKHWRAHAVPVETIRELYGVMTSRGAVGGYVVTSGYFTQPAKDFIDGRSITLLDGEDLARMLSKEEIASSDTVSNSPFCPVCGNKMLRRKAKQGANTLVSR